MIRSRELVTAPLIAVEAPSRPPIWQRIHLPNAGRVSEGCSTLLAMPGGFHTHHQLDRGLTLGHRTDTASPSEQPTPDAGPRPCWITPTNDEPIPGHVVAWQHQPDGWQATIVLTLSADQVHPRT